MRLRFKQRMFSWFDSYDIYDEEGNVVFSVEGQLSWGHCLHVLNAAGEHVATVQQKVFAFLPCFELYQKGEHLGCIQKEFSFFVPTYHIDFMGWNVEGSVLEWEYTIYDQAHLVVAVISKELFNWTDTYTIDVSDPENALYALMLVLAVDAERCSRK